MEITKLETNKLFVAIHANEVIDDLDFSPLENQDLKDHEFQLWGFGTVPADQRSSLLTNMLERFVKRLPGITFLNLMDNRLDTLPEVIGCLPNLETLLLSGNCLQTLPESFCQLTNLKKLDLEQNFFDVLPACIGKLINLEWLHVSQNKLKQLPPESIENLVKLEYFSLCNNELKILPHAIVKLTSLRTLDVISNQLRTFSRAISQLTNLQTLYIAQNQLRTLPSTIGQLTNLRELNASQNQLKTLPESLSGLVNLQTVYAYKNPDFYPPLWTGLLLESCSEYDRKYAFNFVRSCYQSAVTLLFVSKQNPYLLTPIIDSILQKNLVEEIFLPISERKNYISHLKHWFHHARVNSDMLKRKRTELPKGRESRFPFHFFLQVMEEGPQLLKAPAEVSPSPVMSSAE